MNKILKLELKALETRKALLTMIYKAKTGHTGGSLSSADILTALYYEILQGINPENPTNPDRDRFIMSKGHCVEGLYCILADKGFFPKEELDTFCQYNSRLIGHPSKKVPGVELNTGALGHGLPCSVGMALGAKKSSSNSRIFCMMGDGELAEGSIWEAAMSAANYKLDNLTAIIDRNRLQISGNTEEVMKLEGLSDKWKSFGWDVLEIDGNDMKSILETFKSENNSSKPRLIIANTIKGKGVKEMENVAKWHHGVPSEETFDKAIINFDNMIKEKTDE